MTAPAPLATAQDVADQWRPLTDAETDQVERLIGKASALLRQALPSVDSRIELYGTDPTDPLALNPDVVSTVVAGAVKRLLANPTGAASDSETIGPYSRTVSYSSSGANQGTGYLEITASDLEHLEPARKYRARVGSIRLRPSLAPRPVGRLGGLPFRELVGFTYDVA